MANEGDEAQAVIEREEAIRAKQIEQRRNEVKHKSEFCIDCDDLIPEARHLAVGNAIRCTHCEDINATRTQGYSR